VTRLLKTRSNFSKSVVVSIAVSSLGASSIHVLEPGVKQESLANAKVSVLQQCMYDGP